MRVIAINIAGFFLIGCQTAYLERSPDFASFGDIQPSTTPIAINLDCEFYKHGKRDKSSEKCLRAEVLSVIEATGTFLESKDKSNQNVSKLKVVLKNESSRSESNLAIVRYHFLSLPSLGYFATYLEQPAVVDITLFWPDGSMYRREYPHRVHVYGGRHTPPERCVKLTKKDLAEEMVEDVLLSFIRDLQQHHLQTSTNHISTDL